MNISQIETLKLKRFYVKTDIVLHGKHAYAMAIRAAFLAGHLELLSVEHRDPQWARPQETDLKSLDSISTYDGLVRVSMDDKFNITMFIREGTESLRAEPSRHRATFKLKGKWWLVKELVEEIEQEFMRHVVALKGVEDAEAYAKRCREIAEELLDGTYEHPAR
jgi:hypothetical protein